MNHQTTDPVVIDVLERFVEDVTKLSGGVAVADQARLDDLCQIAASLLGEERKPDCPRRGGRPTNGDRDRDALEELTQALFNFRDDVASLVEAAQGIQWDVVAAGLSHQLAFAMRMSQRPNSLGGEAKLMIGMPDGRLADLVATRPEDRPSCTYFTAVPRPPSVPKVS